MSEWISVKDSLPSNGQEVLIYDYSSVFWGLFAKGEFWEADSGSMVSDTPSYWMPTPALPE